MGPWESLWAKGGEREEVETRSGVCVVTGEVWKVVSVE